MDRKYINRDDWKESTGNIQNTWPKNAPDNAALDDPELQADQWAGRLVKAEWVENALEYLASNSAAAARASAMRERAENERKQMRAKLMLSVDNPEKSVQLREAWALAHDDYIAACRKAEQAFEEERTHFRYQSDSSAIISAWQTEERVIRDAERIR